MSEPLDPRLLVGEVMSVAIKQESTDPEFIDGIYLAYSDGRRVVLSPVGAWGQQAWITIRDET